MHPTLKKLFKTMIKEQTPGNEFNHWNKFSYKTRNWYAIVSITFRTILKNSGGKCQICIFPLFSHKLSAMGWLSCQGTDLRDAENFRN